MKVQWKTSGESFFMNLGNDSFLFKFSTSDNCSEVWKEKPNLKTSYYSSKMERKFCPFSETLNSATLWA